jgi:sugar phosphate permease
VAKRVAIFAAFTAAFFLSQFFRHANAVIAPDIARELSLGAGRLGLMTSLFYLAFAAAQLPLGGALDRFGPRVVTPGLMLVAVPGCLIFASGHVFGALALGRALIGLGMAGVLMGAYMAFGRWFPARRFATVSGALMAVGSLGGLGAAAPLAWLNETYGWRAVFVVSAGIVVLSALFVFSVAGGRLGDGAAARRAVQVQADGASVQGALGHVLGDIRFWRIAPMYFFMPGVVMATQGLWAGPLLYDVLRLSPVKGGGYLMLISVGLSVGYVVSGWLGDRMGPGRVVFVAAALFVLTQVGLIGLTRRPSQALVPWLYFLYGFTAGFQVLLLVHARAVFPAAVTGRAITAVNMFGFLGAAAMQWSMGLIIGAYGKDAQGHYPPDAYMAALCLTAGGLALALIWYAPLALRRTGIRREHSPASPPSA